MMVSETTFSKTKIKSPDVTPRPDVKYSDKGKINFFAKTTLL